MGNSNIYKKVGPEYFEALYKEYSTKMYGICLRFAGNEMEAEDILHEGFIKVMTKMKYFRNEGSFDGWIRRIFVNTAINYYRKKTRNPFNEDIESVNMDIPNNNKSWYSDLFSRDEIIKMIHSLPNGYRTVFNLYVVEGYSHKEIAEMLGISDNTSKSQLKRAKAILKRRALLLMKEKIKVPFGDFKVIRNEKKKFINQLQQAV